jgi:dienelactone hydrolase
MWLEIYGGSGVAEVPARGGSFPYHGYGMVVRRPRGARGILAKHSESQLGFSRAVVYYPDCRAREPWKTAVPVLMLLGGDDDMTPAKSCQEAVKRVPTPAAVKIVVYPGALHGFDVPELPTRMRYGFGSIGYQPQAAADARREIEQFLRAGR